MDDSEWLDRGLAGGGEHIMGDERWDEPVCPGYAVNQPLIGEIVAYWRDYDSGNWGSMHRDEPAVIEDGVRHFAASVDSHRAFVIRKREEERKANQK